MSSYNDKLFSGGIRGYLHQMRFRWLRKQLRKETDDSYSMFELGCFDCRSLSYLPKPNAYVGADADWEGGLQSAKVHFSDIPWADLVVARSVADLAPFTGRSFDYSVALETIEHIPDAVLKGYIEFLARVTRKRLFISVPVEIGPVFLAKHLAKRTISGWESGDTDTYSFMEVIWQTLGKVERVRRFEHKGFSYRKLVETLSQHFTIVAVEGIPFKPVPYLSFQAGIIAEPKVRP